MVYILFKVGIFHSDFSKKAYPIEYLTNKVGYLGHYKDSPHLPYEVKRKQGRYFAVNPPPPYANFT